MVTGIGEVDGRPVVVMSKDFTVDGGSNGLLGNEKQRRAWEIAATRGVPVVMLFDGGGHRIQEGLDARDFSGGFDIQEIAGTVVGVGPDGGGDHGASLRPAGVGGLAVRLRRRGEGDRDAGDGATRPGARCDRQDAQASFGTIDLAVDTEDEALEALRD